MTDQKPLPLKIIFDDLPYKTKEQITFILFGLSTILLLANILISINILSKIYNLVVHYYNLARNLTDTTNYSLIR